MTKRIVVALIFAAACGGPAATDAGVVAPDAGPPPPFVEDERWHRQVVFYELWVRSFQDSDGDGIGDLPGLTSRLDYLQELGIGGLWLMPTYPSPLADSGYDVADYIGVHPDYGTMADMDAFLAAAHARGIRVFLDIVFNHTSTAHAWFEGSRTDPTGTFGNFFVWADAAGMNCEGPLGPFGLLRWAEDPVRQQFYFHQFYPAQPDLNFDEPMVQQELLNVMRFWLDRGVDGFRLDVAHRYDEDLPSCVHRPATFAFHRRMRGVMDEYTDRAMVGEVQGSVEEIVAYLGDGTDGLHMTFLLAEATQYWLAASAQNAAPLGSAMSSFARAAPHGATFATLLGNHDIPRSSESVAGDVAQLRAMAAAQLTMPGAPFVYYGEELGMRAGTESIVDGRDSARTPMQWDASPTAGFTSGTPFLALAAEHETRNVAGEEGDPSSLLEYYRALIALRNATPALRTGTFQLIGGVPRAVLAHWRRHPDSDRIVIVSFDPDPVSVRIALPPEWATSDALTDTLGGSRVGTIADGVFSVTLAPRSALVLSM